MAEFLIMAKNNTHADPIKDARGCYKRGDIVEVFEDGRLQTPPPNSPFALVRVTGVTKAQADKYMEVHSDNTDPENPVILKRRVYNIDYTLLPQSIINQLRDNREITVTVTQVKNFIRNKVTNAIG